MFDNRLKQRQVKYSNSKLSMLSWIVCQLDAYRSFLFLIIVSNFTNHTMRRSCVLEKWIDTESALSNGFIFCLELSYQATGRTLGNLDQKDLVDRARWICFGLAVGIFSYWQATGNIFLNSLELKFFNEDVNVSFDFDGLLRLSWIHIQILL